MDSTRRYGDDDWPAQEQLLRVAWYYYVDGMTQDDIAKRINVSRASAGRLLERCRQSGVVSFTINSEYYSAFRVSRMLKEKFGLREVLVPPGLETDAEQQSVVNTRLGRGGAQYLQSHLRPGDLLGMGWGDTVQQTMEQLQPDALAGVRTVSLTGGVGAYLDNLRRARAGRDHGTLDAVLPTPILASSEGLAEALRAETQVQQGLDLARQADHAIVGIGALSGGPTLAKLGYAAEDELERNAAAGAVGDILGVFYDAEGTPLDLPIHRRRIGIDLDDLRAIPNVVGVAGGRAKLDAIRGALGGGYLDVLVTTEEVARALLDEEGTETEDVA
ncbi:MULTISPECIES: sugar-binding transcriptional regulator [unclassified Actinotalea]|uniref:sugar-binding transcriptional regulator n=1 Tax=unclassified Actinotalea TaxID=2638618 RepID=UPI0015F44E12|nr:MULTISPECIES: sugar-binding transcriptional regulator [unclassified Actinotalea]